MPDASSTVYKKPTSKLALSVYENKNAPSTRDTDYRLSKGATVTANSTAETNKKGQARVTYSGDTVTVSKKGYVTRAISTAALRTNPTVWLQKTSDNGPVISALWMDNHYDIMNAEYPLTLKQNTAYTVQAEVDWGKSTKGSVRLTQGTKTLTISDTGATSLVWSDYFDVSLQILVVATDANGKTCSKKLQLGGDLVTDQLEEYELSWGDKMGFKLPKDIPIVGGMEMNMGLYSKVPIQFAVEDNKVYLAIGMQKDAEKSSESPEESVKEYVGFAKTLEKAVEKAEKGLASHNDVQTAMKKMKKMVGAVKGSWSIDAGYSFMGYAEGYFDESYNLHFMDSGLVVSVNASAKYTQPFAIGPVPLYAEVGISGEVEAQLALAIAEAVKNIAPSGTLTGEVKVDIGAGVGVKNLATVGGGITGKLTNEVVFVDRSLAAMQARIGLDGYFKVTALCFEEKIPFKLAEKVVYEYPDYGGYSLYQDEGENGTDGISENGYDTIYSSGNYTQPDLSYLAAGSDFLANGGGMRRMSRAVSVDDVTTFLLNSYENAAPQLLVLSDGTAMAVWTGYDGSRSGMNALCLYYSYYNGSSWSEPAVLDNDGTMDCGFVLREIDGAPCVVWENASAPIGVSDDLQYTAGVMDISFGRYENGAFVCSDVTSATGFDSMPDFCKTDSGIAVVWAHSDSDDIFTSEAVNQVMCSTLTAEGWSSEEALYTNVAALNSLAADCVGGALQVAYSVDTDGDLTTSADMEVYINGSAATSDSAIDSGVQYDNGQLYWYKDGALMCGGSELLPAESGLGSDRYQVIDADGVKAVLFIRSNGVYSSLCGIFYDEASEKWGTPVALTDGSDCVNAFSAAVTADGIQVLVNRLAVVCDDGSAEPYGEAEIDLLTLSLGSNLTLDEVYCDMQYYVADYELPITLTVTNNGRQAVEQVKVTICDEAGAELSSQTFDASLLAGMTQELEIGLKISEVVQGKKITVQVEPVDNTELDDTDNTAELELRQEDMALENMSWGVDADGNVVVYADVVNRGYSIGNSQSVSLRKGSSTGEVVNTLSLGSTGALDLQRVSFDVAYEEGAVYYLTLDDCADDSAANDTDFVVLRSKTTDSVLVGDVNGDGSITAADMQRLYTHLNGTDPLSDTAAADINGDGSVTAADMQRLYTHLNGTDPLS